MNAKHSLNHSIKSVPLVLTGNNIEANQPPRNKASIRTKQYRLMPI
jgi:hypothetical protein